MIGQATQEITIVWKVAVICDYCGSANMYAVQGEVADEVPCGHCPRIFTAAEIQGLIDAASP